MASKPKQHDDVNLQVEDGVTIEKISVAWLNNQEADQFGTAAGRHLENTEIDNEQGKIKFNPFIDTKKVQTTDYQLTEIREAFEKGEISLQDMIAAMGRAYTVNHSVGADVLYDKRLKVENRIDRYVEWAVAQGQDAEAAAKYAALEILKHGEEQGSLAGNGWGGINTKRDIRKKKRA